jgi:uridylate kinase
MTGCRWNRALLKLSGEVLSGGGAGSFERQVLARIADDLIDACSVGVQLAVLTGGGNILRGRAAGVDGMSRILADRMGMLATTMNALALRDALLQRGHPAEILNAVEIPGVAAGFEAHRARDLLASGSLLLLGGGTGLPFFSTDTAGALRALEIGADVLLKGTKVRGVFSSDPGAGDGAVPEFFSAIAYDEVIRRGLAVMDLTAITLCREYSLPVCVFDVTQPESIRRVLTDSTVGSLVHERSAS